MKIFYMNHVSYIGGAEIGLLTLLTYLDRERFQPVVLAPPGELADAVRRLEVPHIAIPELPGVNRYTLVQYFRKLWGVYWKIRQDPPELIHANTNFTSCYAGWLGKWLNIPTVGHIRDIEPLGRVSRAALRRNTALIAISGAVQRYLTAEGVGESRIIQIHNGVDLKRYHPPVAGETPRAQKTCVLGLVGQVGQRKGHLNALKALKSLLSRDIDVELWIVGKEPEHSVEGYTEQLHRYIQEHQFERRVKFWGYRTDIPDILAHIDLLMLPSRQEPFGRIVIEAMAMNLPVVATHVGGVPEIVRDHQTGLLVPPDDSEALADAVQQLCLEPELRQQFGTAGRTRVEQFFDVEHNTRKTEQLYKRLSQRTTGEYGLIT